MRIGIYGGTFDPIHYAHLLLAEQCREQCRLDEVWFVPAAIPPHKRHLAITNGDQRLAMIERAIADNPHFRACRIELDRPTQSFTVDTLRQLGEEHPGQQWFLLLGGDSVVDFPKWRQPDDIARMATIVSVNRGRQPVSLATWEGWIPPESIAAVLRVEMPALDTSATRIREAVRNRWSIRYQTPPEVIAYISDNQLYTRGQR